MTVWPGYTEQTPPPSQKRIKNLYFGQSCSFALKPLLLFGCKACFNYTCDFTGVESLPPGAQLVPLTYARPNWIDRLPTGPGRRNHSRHLRFSRRHRYHLETTTIVVIESSMDAHRSTIMQEELLQTSTPQRTTTATPTIPTPHSPAALRWSKPFERSNSLSYDLANSIDYSPQPSKKRHADGSFANQTPWTGQLRDSLPVILAPAMGAEEDRLHRAVAEAERKALDKELRRKPDGIDTGQAEAAEVEKGQVASKHKKGSSFLEWKEPVLR